jgi:hypothetical protein
LVSIEPNDHSEIRRRLVERAFDRPVDAEALGTDEIARRRIGRTKPLFDTALYAKHIESAYVAMYRRHQNSLVPDPIHAPA